MKIVYMGTPDFAVGALRALVEAGHQIAAVVTQPDKPKGRGKEMQMTPVKEAALELDIPVYQPAKVREEGFLQQLKDLNPEVIVVAAFGQILPQRLLDIPAYGCINIHASLLPKYRGSAPIQQVILDGEKETGITIMQMDKGLDTGDMLMKTEIVLDEKETGGSLHDKLARAGAGLCGGAVKIHQPLQEDLCRQQQDGAALSQRSYGQRGGHVLGSGLGIPAGSGSEFQGL